MNAKLKCLAIAVGCVVLSAKAMAIPTQYTIIEDAADNAKVTTSFSHGNGQTNPGQPVDPYGYYTIEFPKMNDYNDVANKVSAAFAVDPRITGTISGEATIWKGANSDDGTGVRSRTSLGLVFCREGNSLCGSRALDINNIGIVSGSSHDFGFGGSYPEKAYFWRNGWYSNSFGAFGGQSYISDINENSNMVGSGIHNLDYWPHGGVKVNGANYTIGELSVQSSYAHALNNLDEVTGQALFGTAHHAFHWELVSGSAVLTDLGTLGDSGSFSVGYDINESGNIVGYSDTLSGVSRAFVWNKSANQMQDLGVLGSTANDNASIARSINNLEQVVGYSTTSTGEFHAFIYEAGVMYDLNDLIPQASGWQLVDAYHINEYGEILVRGTRGAENKYMILTFDGITKCRSCDYPESTLFEVESAGQVSGNGSSNSDYSAVEVDALGNVYSLVNVGYNSIANGHDLDPTLGQDNRTAIGTYLQKMNPDGTYVWSKLVNVGESVSGRFGTSEGHLELEVDVEGSIYIGYSIKTSRRYYDVVIKKFNSSGDEINRLAASGRYNGVYLSSIDSDKNGNLYIAMRVYRPVDWSWPIDMDPTLGVNNFSELGDYVSKVSKNGNYLGTIFLPAVTSSSMYSLGAPSSIVAVSDGGFYLLGEIPTNSSLDMDASSAGTTILSSGATERSLFLVKYDGTGNYLWSRKTFAASSFVFRKSVRVDLQGNAYTFHDVGVNAKWLQKFSNNDGSALWQPIPLTGWFNYTYADRVFEVDSAGNAYVIGLGNSTSGFDYDFTPEGSDVQFGQMFISKVLPDGSYGGTSSYGDLYSSAHIRSVGISSTGEVTLVGRYVVSIDDILTEPNGGGSRSGFMLKLKP